MTCPWIALVTGVCLFVLAVLNRTPRSTHPESLHAHGSSTRRPCPPVQPGVQTALVGEPPMRDAERLRELATA
jgi:hypothetical protein